MDVDVAVDVAAVAVDVAVYVAAVAVDVVAAAAVAVFGDEGVVHVAGSIVAAASGQVAAVDSADLVVILLAKTPLSSGLQDAAADLMPVVVPAVVATARNRNRTNCYIKDFLYHLGNV